jgi:murein DD-endopeptidase MepM/ murein hydrolase activator NlpD
MIRIQKADTQRGAFLALALIAAASLCACASSPGPQTYLDWGVRDSMPRHWPSATYVTVVARPHDTVATIAARFDVPESSVRHLNNIGSNDSIHAGDVLRIPPGSERTREAVMREADSAKIYAEPHDADYVNEHVVTRTLAPVRVAHNDYVSPRAPMLPHDDYAASPDSTHFIWPVSGRIESGFGGSANGERNDGLNIATSEGAPIRAAASGTVTYVGNELHTYGNLVIIKHAGNYITVYAHAQHIDVSKGQQVWQGQVIATAGSTGNVDHPELHFEVRYNTQPVNPRPLMASGTAAS